MPRGRPKVGAIGQGQDIDRYVGVRIRERRIMLGLTQRQMTELIGVTPQQVHKYESGISRIGAGRLHGVAQALGVEVAYFYEGVQQRPKAPNSQHRLVLELARNFMAIRNSRQRDALTEYMRTMAGCDH